MNWYLLQCKPNQQNRAEEHLANQGFITYAPQLKVERVIRRKRVVRDEAVFPGYVFIQLDHNSDWRTLRATRGVSRAVSFNGQPYPIHEELIEGLRLQYSSQQTPMSLFKPGDVVSITEGCFKDLQAIVKAATAGERIVVLMTILQSEQAVAIPVAQLRKAG